MTGGIEPGLRFRSSTAGYIEGISFYKFPQEGILKFETVAYHINIVFSDRADILAGMEMVKSVPTFSLLLAVMNP